MARRPSIAADAPMSARDYLAWYAGSSGHVRHELVDGRPVAMAPERARHATTKLDVALALRRAIDSAALDCTVFGDGMSVVVDELNVYEPDALVQCGRDWKPDDVELSEPLIVVEVLSPSTGAKDSGAKLAGYLGLAPVRHYLIVDPDSRLLIHHAKRADGTIATAVVREGSLALDPPGLELDVRACFTSLSGRMRG